MVSKPIHWAGRALRIAGTEIVTRYGIQGTWIDVGAHHGESSLVHARHNPGLRVYAVEPNLRTVGKLLGRLPNYLVIPIAVSEKNGCADFHVNAYDAASSLLPFSKEGLRSWTGAEDLKVDAVVTVPTICLDTLMDLLEIERVDFLRVDTQGMDLAVLRSAGSRLRDIAKIALEVWIAPVPLYEGAASKDEVVAFLEEAGFRLVGGEKQTYGQEENLTFAQCSRGSADAHAGSSAFSRVERK